MGVSLDRCVETDSQRFDQRALQCAYIFREFEAEIRLMRNILLKDTVYRRRCEKYDIRTEIVFSLFTEFAVSAGLSRLHRHEMEMMLALNSLEQATGRKMAGEVIFSHTGRDGTRHGRMAFEKMQRLLAPVEQMCAGSEEFRDICDQFGKHKRALGETWREKLAIDAQARALWQPLEDELLRLVNAVSSREVQRSLENTESLSEAADYIVWSIFLFTLGLLAFLFVLLLLLRRDLLRPLVRIAGNLSRLRDGMQPEPIPAVRITELQEVVDIVPDIGGYLGSLRERSCRLEEEKDAHARMSLMDSLTGIPNRRALDMRLADLAELRQAASLIMLDVDLFKIYNDTLGHQEGDACLHRVAQAMRDGLRGGDCEIFRYGGEEFAVVLDEVSPEHALHVAERLRQTVEQLVTAGITTVAALISWWKNNSFTAAAVAADSYMARLKQKQ